MKSSYKEDEVTILLKDITGMVKPQPASERERLIQGGRHYCEMLPLEYSPTLEYMETYHIALSGYAALTAEAVGRAADQIIKKKGKKVVLVSLARAGIPVAILIKRYIRWKYGIDVVHYAISIIRGRGIDKNAMKFILERHKPEEVQFVDGWIGKGAILQELKNDLKEYDGVSPELAVLADPANETTLCGTHEDILIPSSCLNCTVSGLISRTFLRSDIIGAEDFHGAAYYGELKEHDLSEEFLSSIEREFVMEAPPILKKHQGKGIEEVKRIAEYFHISNNNFIKPGIGEATRVLLRRVPWKILIQKEECNNPMLSHLIRLAEEKNVPIMEYPLINYKACGIIKQYADT